MKWDEFCSLELKLVTEKGPSGVVGFSVGFRWVFGGYSVGSAIVINRGSDNHRGPVKTSHQFFFYFLL